MEDKCRVLVVDDDEDICSTMKDILEMEGYEACIANDGYVALEMIRNESFDVVLMDIKMPGIDGVETFKRLKEFASIPVIMVSAYAVGDLIKEATREGAFAVLQKPIDFQLLFKTIESSRGDGAFVLFVDDDKNACEMIKNVLVRNNYNVVIAYDGATAIQKVKTMNFDVIILDMKMPVLNGLETYLGIRELRPEAVVIVISGYPLEMNSLANQALESGAYSYLQKPFSIELLLDALGNICK